MRARSHVHLTDDSYAGDASRPATGRRRKTMSKKLAKILAGLAMLAALALGGATLASAGQGGSQPAKPAAAVQTAEHEEGSEKADSNEASDDDGPGDDDAEEND